jgi:hypothetical protein
MGWGDYLQGAAGLGLTAASGGLFGAGAAGFVNGKLGGFLGGGS